MIDEILVHISAPTTRQNDEVYRCLAGAYLDFEPYRTLEDGPRWRENEPDRHPIPEHNPSNLSSERTLMHRTADIPVLSTSKDSYGSFPSLLSFEEQGMAQELASTQEIGSSEGGSVPPSSRLARLESIHTEWKQQHAPRSSILDEAGRLSTNPGDADTAFIEDTQFAAQALQSQLQDTSFSMYEDAHQEELQTEANTGKGHESDVEQNSDSSGHSSIECVSDSLDFTLLPFDALPPAPAVSVIQPSTLPSQATAYLAAIQTQNPTRFKPSKFLYPPKPDDRGYWLIESSTWPLKTQHEFWSILCKHVESGRLGWGITLYRESGSSQALGLSKLYCWGELVEHTWLVLWLCSRGKISGTGSKWLGADGVVGIVMP